MGFFCPHTIDHMSGKYLMSCYLCPVIIDEYKMAVKFDIHFVSYISARNGVLAFVPPYMGVAADLMPVRPLANFIRDGRQDSQIWFFFRFKDYLAAAGTLLERLVMESF